MRKAPIVAALALAGGIAAAQSGAGATDPPASAAATDTTSVSMAAISNAVLAGQQLSLAQLGFVRDQALAKGADAAELDMVIAAAGAGDNSLLIQAPTITVDQLQHQSTGVSGPGIVAPNIGQQMQPIAAKRPARPENVGNGAHGPWEFHVAYLTRSYNNSLGWRLLTARTEFRWWDDEFNISPAPTSAHQFWPGDTTYWGGGYRIGPFDAPGNVEHRYLKFGLSAQGEHFDKRAIIICNAFLGDVPQSDPTCLGRSAGYDPNGPFPTGGATGAWKAVMGLAVFADDAAGDNLIWSVANEDIGTLAPITQNWQTGQQRI